MTNEKKSSIQQSETTVMSHGSLLGMLSWRIIGPMLLVGNLFFIGKKESWFHFWDLAFVGTLVFMVTGRYIEQRSGNGRTLYDEPSTWRHFAVYTRNLGIVALILWIAVKALTIG